MNSTRAAAARAFGSVARRVFAVAAPEASNASFVGASAAPGGAHAHVRALGAFAANRGYASAAAEAAMVDLDEDEIEMKGVKLRGRPLYLDMQATTPVRRRCRLNTSA